MEDDWNVAASEVARNSWNPLREYVGRVTVPDGHPKEQINLTFGDPSIYPDFAPSPVAVQILLDCVIESKGNGYIPALGTPEARAALAKRYSNDAITLSAEDVSVDFGGSGAVMHTIRALCNPGDNYLIPSPGFPLYSTLANSQFQARCYRLLPDQGWEADLEHLESLIDHRTRFIVVINPSNPCGSVYSREHLLEILEIARRRKLPVLADEVYEGVTFSKPFVSMGKLCDVAPVIIIGCLSKRWLVPGWRLGWIVICDKFGALNDFRRGLYRLKTAMIHPTSFVVRALPRILTEIPESFFEETNLKLKSNAEKICQIVNSIPGLSMRMPEGSIYAIVQIDFEILRDIPNSITFCEMLAKEQAVLLIPLEVFFSFGGFRLVLCNPISVLEITFERIHEFIRDHIDNKCN